MAGLLNDLEEPYRTTLVLRFFEGLSSVQIGSRMKVPAGTVRWRIQEGLGRLRARLDERHGGDRESWVLALAPFVRRPLPGGAAAGAPVAAPTAGLSIALPVVVVVALAVGGLLLAGGERRAPPSGTRLPWSGPPSPDQVPHAPGPSQAAGPAAPAAQLVAPSPKAVAPGTPVPRPSSAEPRRARAPESRAAGQPSPQQPAPGVPVAPAPSRHPMAAEPAPARTGTFVPVPPAAPETKPGVLVAVGGRVTSDRGTPAADLIVYAVDAQTRDLAGVARPDGAGIFTLRLPAGRRHDIGVISERWRVHTVQPLAPDGVRVVVLSSPDPFALASDEKPLPFKLRPQPIVGGTGIEPSTYGRMRGHVRDERGGPLAAVQLVVSDPGTKRVMASAVSRNDGSYELAAPAGYVLVRFAAPGLTVTERRRDVSGQAEIRMALRTDLVTVVVSDGHAIKFKMSDSLWPEIEPPPTVKGWIRTAWGFEFSDDAGTPPSSNWFETWQGRLPPYWWLRLLRARAPASPHALVGRMLGVLEGREEP